MADKLLSPTADVDAIFNPKPTPLPAIKPSPVDSILGSIGNFGSKVGRGIGDAAQSAVDNILGLNKDPLINPVESDSSSPAMAQQSSTLPPIQAPSWDDFVKKAETIAAQRKFPASVLLGQAQLESGGGTSNFAQNRNNYFGYKAYDSNPDAATTFASPEDAINKYIDLVTTDPRYVKAGVPQALQSGNPYHVVRAIKQAGYASDPQYVDKVTNTPMFRKYLQGGN
jgi:flagellum-specific peptidoglycan hydrolase FlgJ